MYLYNTLTRKLEEIQPTKDGIITMYNCGPTVYSRQHIGNFRAFLDWDILHRALLFLGFKVKRIMNITDVGHLVSDEDTGEDKMEKGARQLGTNDPFKVAEYFTKLFLNDSADLNLLSPSGKELKKDLPLEELENYGWIRATKSIDTIIEIVKKIVEHGFTYETDQALYFDVTKYDDYTKLYGQKLEDKLVGVREEVNVDPGKKHPADFVLWMKRAGQYKDHIMHWSSPWGDGFPGWHIECSAMAVDYLGQEISIHTGGIEHISVHHTNEIAQNFGAYEKEIVKMWVHNEHLKSDGGAKLSKSLGNAYNIDELKEKGFDPMDLRLFLTSINYKMPINFSLEALEGAKNSRLSIISKLKDLKSKADGEGKIVKEYYEKFSNALNDNLNVSEAYAVLSELLRSDSKPEDIIKTAFEFDRVFGLKLKDNVEKQVNIPAAVEKLLQERKGARDKKDFKASDQLRKQIEDMGYEVLDTAAGQEVREL